MGRKRRRSTFGSIIQRPGRPGYYLRFRLRGRETVRYAGPDARTAEEFRARVLRQVAREDLLDERAIAPVSLAEFQPMLLAHLRANHAKSTVAAALLSFSQLLRS